MGKDLHPIANRVYRPEVYRSASQLLNIIAPSEDVRLEGESPTGEFAAVDADGLGRGSSLFCDGSRFDSADPNGYIHGFEIHHRRVQRKRIEAFS